MNAKMLIVLLFTVAFLATSVLTSPAEAEQEIEAEAGEFAQRRAVSGHHNKGPHVHHPLNNSTHRHRRRTTRATSTTAAGK
ncbi:hypothetical protein CHUAL_012800 [Chamberlinius hualienensis]